MGPALCPDGYPWAAVRGRVPTGLHHEPDPQLYLLLPLEVKLGSLRSYWYPGPSCPERTATVWTQPSRTLGSLNTWMWRLLSPALSITGAAQFLAPGMRAWFGGSFLA